MGRALIRPRCAQPASPRGRGGERRAAGLPLPLGEGWGEGGRPSEPLMRRRNLKMQAQRMLLGALLACTLGCGASQPAAPAARPPAAPAGQAAATAEPWQQQWDEVLAAAQKEGKVVVDVPGEVID